MLLCVCAALSLYLRRPACLAWVPSSLSCWASPLTLSSSLGSLLCGGICVSACQLLRRKPLVPRMTRGSWGDVLLLASIGTALPLVCIVIGLARTSAITGSFLLQSQGPAALLFALLFL